MSNIVSYKSPTLDGYSYPRSASVVSWLITFFPITLFLSVFLFRYCTRGGYTVSGSAGGGGSGRGGEPRSPLLAIISNRKRIILDQTRNYENVSDWRLFYEVDKDRAVSVIKLRLRCRCLLGYRYCAVFLELEIHYMLM